MKKHLLVKFFVFILIIVVVSALLILLTVYAKKNQRDVQRLSDISRIRIALELYFFNRHKYPVAQTSVILGNAGALVICDTDEGVQNISDGCGKVFMERVPKDPLFEQGFVYSYASDGNTYSIDFVLEKSDSGLTAGSHRATPESIE